MARPINQRCIECALLATEAAHHRACWDGVRCHNRRSYYRGKLAQQQRAQEEPPVPSPHTPVVLDVPLPETPTAILYRYHPPESSTTLHAVCAELYRGSHLVAKTKPIHTGALTERTLRIYLQNVLDVFSRQVNAPITLFRESINLPLNRHACPVAGCHLHASQSDG